MSASRDLARSTRYCRIESVFYGVLAVMGLIPGLNTMFGLVPMFNHSVSLHAVLAVALGYYDHVHYNTPADL